MGRGRGVDMDMGGRGLLMLCEYLPCVRGYLCEVGVC